MCPCPQGECAKAPSTAQRQPVTGCRLLFASAESFYYCHIIKFFKKSPFACSLLVLYFSF